MGDWYPIGIAVGLGLACGLALAAVLASRRGGFVGAIVAIRRGGTTGGTAFIMGGVALSIAALSLIPVIGYVLVVVIPALAARRARAESERYAGLRTLAK